MPAKTRNVLLILPLCIGLILILTSTTHLIRGFWNYDTKRLLELAFLPFLFAFTLLYPPLRAAFTLQLQQVSIRNRWLLVAIFSIGVISSIYHADSLRHASYSLLEVFLMSALVIAALVIAAVRTMSGTAFDRLAMSLLVILGLGVGVQELVGVAAASSIGMEFNFRISLLHFSWPRFFNQVQSWTIPVLAALPALFWRKRLAQILCVCVIALNWYVLLMTGARGTVVGLVSAMAIILILFPGVRREALKWHIVGLVSGALIYLAVLSFWMDNAQPAPVAEALTSQTKEVSELEEAERSSNRSNSAQNSFYSQSLGRKMLNTSGRWAMWQGALGDIQANPLWGIGPMNYACKGRLNEAGHPHSFPLQVATEWGLPATLMLILLLAPLAWKAGRKLRTDSFDSDSEHFLAVLLAAGILTAAVHSCLSGVLVMPASQLTGVLICGWFLGILSPQWESKKGEPDDQLKQRRANVHVFLALLLIMSSSALIFSVKEIGHRNEVLASTEVGDRIIPRFWQNGKACGF